MIQNHKHSFQQCSPWIHPKEVVVIVQEGCFETAVHFCHDKNLFNGGFRCSRKVNRDRLRVFLDGPDINGTFLKNNLTLLRKRFI